MNGYGIYSWNDGSMFEGNFVDGKPNGQGKITEYKTGRVHEGFYEDVNKKIDSVYGPDIYVINKGNDEANKFLKKACKDGRSYYRRKVLAKGGDHLNVFNIKCKSLVVK